MVVEAAVVSVVLIQMIFFGCFSAEERVLSNCYFFGNHNFFSILIFFFYKNHFDKWSKVAVVLAAVVFLVAEEILIWMISEMMTILGKNITSKKPNPNH